MSTGQDTGGPGSPYRARFAVPRLPVPRFAELCFVVLRFGVARFVVPRFVVPRFVVPRFPELRFVEARFVVPRFTFPRLLLPAFALPAFALPAFPLVDAGRAGGSFSADATRFGAVSRYASRRTSASSVQFTPPSSQTPTQPLGPTYGGAKKRWGANWIIRL